MIARRSQLLHRLIGTSSTSHVKLPVIDAGLVLAFTSADGHLKYTSLVKLFIMLVGQALAFTLVDWRLKYTNLVELSVMVAERVLAFTSADQLAFPSKRMFVSKLKANKNKLHVEKARVD